MICQHPDHEPGLVCYDRAVGCSASCSCCILRYEKNFIKDADVIFNALKLLDWERRSDAPRSEYYVNTDHVPYTYGKGRGQRTYQPRLWNNVLISLLMKVNIAFEKNYNVIFLNRYLDQSDHLGWHRDEVTDDIAILSFGVARQIWMRHSTKQTLDHGSLLLMHPDTIHKIPKASFKCGERISLTFRKTGTKELDA